MTKNDILLKAAQTYFSVLGRISPTCAARFAYKLFHTPFNSRRRFIENELLKESAGFRIPFKDQLELSAYRWGNIDDPIILFVHGWTGTSTNFISFIDILVDSGYQVISYDAVAHGNTPGKSTTFIEWVDTVRVVLAELGHVHCVVAHSLGGGAVTVASSLGLDTDKLVLISAVYDAVEVTERFARALSISPITIKKMREYTWKKHYNTASKYGSDWNDIFKSNFKVPTLILHDKDDKMVSFKDGKALAMQWPWADYLETKGLGHSRILLNPKVVEKVVDFISG